MLHRLCDASGEVIKRYFRSPVDVADKADKGPGIYSPVTKADRGAEEVIRKLIKEAYPEHGILGEEFGNEKLDAEYVWVIDPIDGTKAFITGFTSWGTLIGLQRQGRAVLGAMNQPFIGERFIGMPSGTSCNGTPIRTRACPRLEQARLGITDTGMMKTEAQRLAYDSVASRVEYVRLNGDCYSYAMLAEGHIDLVIEGDLMPWDIQALVPIVEGAGGVITQWDGSPVSGGGWIVAAGDAALHAEALALLRDAAPG